MTSFYIVTPVRNGARFLNTAITHIISQAGDFEIYYHIQDGGSTDGTLEIIRKWEKLLTADCPLIQCNRVHFSWASEQDTGMYDAINKGFTKFDIPDDGIMGWCNADDLYMPMAFDCLAKVFFQIPTVHFLAGKWLRYENHGYKESFYHGGIYPKEVMSHGCCDTHLWTSVAQPSAFWKKFLWNCAGPLNNKLKFAGDYDLWRRFAEKTECAYLPSILSLCLCHDAQLGNTKPSSGEFSYYQLEQESICPSAARQAFIKRLWDRRLLPPDGALVALHADGYCVLQRRGWPKSWGPTWKYYFLRRFLYQKLRIKSFFKKILNNND